MLLKNRRSFLQGAGAAMTGLFGLPKLSEALQQTTSPYQRPKLKITDVKTAFLQGFHVRIYTDQGLTGDGEAVDAIGGAAGIVQGFRSSLMSQDPMNMEAIWERIRTSGVFSGAQAGQYITALTAVEIALWDLAGKAVGLPIYQLMGGKMRDRIRVYIDSGTDSRDDPNAKPFIAQIVENGWTMAKIDIDDARDPARFDRVNWTANNAEIDHMVDKVAFMREALPKSIELAVDMHGALRPAARPSASPRRWSLSSWSGWKSRCRRKTSTPCATSANPPTPPFAAARTSICAGASANCSRNRRWTSSCPIYRSAVGWRRRRRSPTWRTYTMFRSPLIARRRPSA